MPGSESMNPKWTLSRRPGEREESRRGVIGDILDVTFDLGEGLRLIGGQWGAGRRRMFLRIGQLRAGYDGADRVELGRASGHERVGRRIQLGEFGELDIPSDDGGVDGRQELEEVAMNGTGPGPHLPLLDGALVDIHENQVGIGLRVELLAEEEPLVDRLIVDALEEGNELEADKEQKSHRRSGDEIKMLLRESLHFRQVRGDWKGVRHALFATGERSGGQGCRLPAFT